MAKPSNGKLTFNQQLYYKKYQIKKNEAVFLSANTWDVSGGGNYGYNAVWVNRNNKIFDKLDYEPKNQIKRLDELLDLI